MTDIDTPDYPSILRSLTARDKLEIMQRLKIDEDQIASFGHIQLLIVTWKYLKSIGERVAWPKLLKLTEDELLDRLGLDVDELNAQIEAYNDDAASDDDEDTDLSKSSGG